MLIDDDYAEKLARHLIGGKLVLFVGAGISLQASHVSDTKKKLPLWAELADMVARDCNISLDEFKGEILDLFDAISQNLSRRELEDAVRKHIPDNDYAPDATHNAIAALPWRRIYTTNYDNLLQRALNERFPIKNEQDFELLNRNEKERPRLIHLHGTLSEMHTLAGEDYQNWQDNHPIAVNRFVTDGLENSFLFVGYSNSDPHFKNQILPLIKKLKADRGHKNYSWMWNPTEGQMRLYQQRDRVDVHPINVDDEWQQNMKLLLDAYNALNCKGGVAPKRSKRSRRFESPGDAQNAIFIHGYKLFYHRDSKNVSREKLSRLSGVKAERIRILETVNLKKPLGDGFKRSSMYEIWNLERALRPNTSLELGKGEDDSYAFYIEYYKNNWRKSRDKQRPQQRGVFRSTRAVVFDFGGTLTIPKFKENTWERIWNSAGYSLKEAGELHHEFSAGRITHQEWCDLTCEKLRHRGFSKRQFESIYRDISPITGLFETFQELRAQNIQIHIVSGSLRDIIAHTLGEAAKYVSSIRSNDFSFDADGVISAVIGHEYDFEGKARFIEMLISELRCHPMDILFVGNSLNDEKAATSGARTLCVNPKYTHPYVESMWNNTIREMTDLREILEFVSPTAS